MKTENKGDSWQVISKNLTLSSNLEKQSVSAGAIAESPIQKGTIILWFR